MQSRMRPARAVRGQWVMLALGAGAGAQIVRARVLNGAKLERPLQVSPSNIRRRQPLGRRSR